MNTEIDFKIKDVNYVIRKSYAKNCKYRVSEVYTYRIMYILNGRGKFIFENEYLTAEKGDIMVFKPMEVYNLISEGDDEWEFCVIAFTAQNDISFFQYPTISKGNAQIREYFMNAEKIWMHKTIAYELYLKGILNIIFYNIIVQTQQYPKSCKFIDDTISYMKENMHKKITVTELAKLACYSNSYYNKAFVNLMGISPIKYLTNLRVEKAKELLNTGMLSISEVSQQCGFDNLYYFSNAFKKNTGKRPSIYKSKNMSEKIQLQSTKSELI